MEISVKIEKKDGTVEIKNFPEKKRGNEMKYNYTMTLERDGEKIELNPLVEFSKNEDDYGNGFHMKVENCGLGFLNIFDCRYDTRLNSKNLNEYFPVFARDYWTGEKGSAKLVKIEEL